MYMYKIEMNVLILDALPSSKAYITRKKNLSEEHTYYKIRYETLCSQIQHRFLKRISIIKNYLADFVES